MIKLSDRLQLMADLVDERETVADIGTDHGFLPFYLWQCGKCSRVILADISSGSMQKAIDNVNSLLQGEEKPEDAFSFRLGDGIRILEPEEADTVIIAGMGGLLMTEILGAEPEKTKSIKKFILQPRNGQGKLRHYLLSQGFHIEKNLLVREGKFICEVLLVKTDKDTFLKSYCDEEIPQNHISYEFPASLLTDNGTIGEEFLQRKIGLEMDILERIEKSGREESLENAEKIRNTRERLSYLQKLSER